MLGRFYSQGYVYHSHNSNRLYYFSIDIDNKDSSGELTLTAIYDHEKKSYLGENVVNQPLSPVFVDKVVEEIKAVYFLNSLDVSMLNIGD